jgi:type II secretion system (T2SS) protein E
MSVAISRRPNPNVMAHCSRESCGRWRPDVIVRWAKLGLTVDGEWFCSNGCVEADAVRRLRNARSRELASRAPALRLGAVLLHQGVVTLRQLSEALEAQRSSGLRLGAQLQTLGHVSRDILLRALSAQNGISYLATVDPASVRTAPGGLSIDEVRALGIVPFRETEEEILIACAAPVPYSAIGALQVLSGRKVQPYLVADDDFERLAAAYGTANPNLQSTTVRDISDGASRIAALAAEAGDVTVREAHVDPFTWVRIDANGRVSTMLVPPYASDTKENAEWLAATTRH